MDGSIFSHPGVLLIAVFFAGSVGVLFFLLEFHDPQYDGDEKRLWNWLCRKWRERKRDASKPDDSAGPDGDSR